MHNSWTDIFLIFKNGMDHESHKLPLHIEHILIYFQDSSLQKNQPKDITVIYWKKYSRNNISILNKTFRDNFQFQFNFLYLNSFIVTVCYQGKFI